MKIEPISPERVHKMDAYWRAANDPSVGQLCLFDNPLLKHPLTLEHIKPQLLGQGPDMPEVRNWKWGPV